MTNRIPLKAKYTGSDTTSLGEFESTDTIDNSYLNTGTAASQLVVLDASARLPAVDGSLLTGISSSGGASDIDGLTDGYSDASSVGLGTGALANDDGTTNRNTARY